MLSGMESIRETLTRLEGLIGPIPEHVDCSINKRLELDMDIVEKATKNMWNSRQKQAKSCRLLKMKFMFWREQ